MSKATLIDYDEFSRLWEAMDEAEHQAVRDKSNWEGMTRFAAMREWPDLIPERLRRVEGSHEVSS